MTSEMMNPGMTPPIDAEALEAPPSKWPTVIGIISLIYAIGGLLCGLGYGLSILFMGWLMELGGMKVQAPTIVTVTGLVMSLFMLIMGILMLTGAINLIRRRRAGVKLLKVWGVLRVALLVLGILITVVTGPAQIQFQRAMADAQAQQLRDAGRTEMIPPEQTDEQIWRKIVIMSGAMSAVMAIYPLFIVFYLSRRKITAETQEWR